LTFLFFALSIAVLTFSGRAQYYSVLQFSGSQFFSLISSSLLFKFNFKSSYSFNLILFSTLRFLFCFEVVESNELKRSRRDYCDGGGVWLPFEHNSSFANMWLCYAWWSWSWCSCSWFYLVSFLSIIVTKSCSKGSSFQILTFLVLGSIFSSITFNYSSYNFVPSLEVYLPFNLSKFIFCFIYIIFIFYAI